MHDSESDTQSLVTEPSREIPALLVAAGSRSSRCRSHIAVSDRVIAHRSSIAIFDRNLPRLTAGRSYEINKEHP